MTGAARFEEAFAWRAVALLCLLYGLSFLDRIALALVMDQVSASLGASDTEIGLLFGMGFVSVYVLAGFPAAQLVDVGNRKRILIAGVLCWSTATFLSAFATSYWMLAVLRSGVAIGEAVLLPAAMSLISDMFSPARRSLPTTIYTLTGVIMGGGSMIIGSGALKLAELFAPGMEVEAWRIMFAIVALPGPLFAVLMIWIIAEPRRTGLSTQRTKTDFGEFFEHFRSRLYLYVPVFVGTGFIFTVTVGMNAWGPTFLAREHGFDPAVAGLVVGLSSVSGAIAGMVIVTGLLRLMKAKPRALAVITTAIVVNLTILPILALLIGSSDSTLVLTGITVGMAGAIATGTFSPLFIQAVTPAQFLGRMSAVYLMFNNLLGMGLGPWLTAALASRVGAPRGIGTALTLLAWTSIVISLACYLFVRRQLNRPSPNFGDISDKAPQPHGIAPG